MLRFDTSWPPIHAGPWPRPSVALAERGHVCNPDEFSWLNNAPETLKWARESAVESAHNHGAVVRALGLLINRPADVWGHWWTAENNGGEVMRIVHLLHLTK